MEEIKIESEEGHDTDNECTSIATVMYNTSLIHMKNGEVDTAKKCFDLVMECFELATEDSKYDDGINATEKTLIFADMRSTV